MIFEAMKQALIAAAERAGLDQYEIYYQREESVSAETLKNEISSFSSSVGGGICFRCIVDGKMGYASGELMTEAAMEELVISAISNAKCIDSEDEVFIFAGSPSYAKLAPREVSLLDAGVIRDTALELQKRTYAESEKVGDGTQSMMLSAVEERKLYNSNGLELSNRVGFSGAYAAPVVREGEEAQENFEFGLGSTLEDFADLPKRAVRGALDKIGATTVASGKYSVVFDGRQFRSFLSTFSPVFSAKNAQLGLSLLAGKEGEKIASDCVNLVDDPMREGCPMQTPFDGEGVATARRNVIENGVLKTLLYDLTTAKKAGVESTGNGQKGGYASPVSIAPYNFGIAAGEQTQEELFAAVGDGVYITECKGFHAGANAVTGDFSIESAGFMIRGGKRAEPIKSFTVAGNFFDLLRQIDALGNDVKWGIPGGFTVFGSPDVLVRDMSIAGK
ncbi:MAG: TldD/PmbA family protein [Ruminococcaceae bacterium]|nr:TldD/PmbA family protein [Oscillospiraceae bacterium]